MKTFTTKIQFFLFLQKKHHRRCWTEYTSEFAFWFGQVVLKPRVNTLFGFLTLNVCNKTLSFLSSVFVLSRTFDFERTNIFIFSYSIWLVTQLNDLASEILKYHYNTRRIFEFMIGNLRFLTQSFLSQLFLYKNIKESRLFMTQIVDILDLNN